MLQSWESIVIGGCVSSTCGATVTQVCLWFGAVGNGEKGFEDKQRPGQYSGLQCACLANASVTVDRHFKVTDYARLLDISLCSAHSRSIDHGQVGIFINCSWVVTRWQYTFT
jgi:hypothetical protein